MVFWKGEKGHQFKIQACKKVSKKLIFLHESCLVNEFGCNQVARRKNVG